MSEWWRVLGLEFPSMDKNVIYEAFQEKHKKTSVIYSNDEELDKKVHDALEEGMTWVDDSLKGRVRG